jgi:hypothetical protein
MKPLPYCRSKQAYPEETRYLQNVFRGKILRRQILGITSLGNARPADYLARIREHSKKSNCFYAFDLAKYYPSVDHGLLIEELRNAYRSLNGKPPSGAMEGLLERLPAILRGESAYGSRGLALGSGLARLLAELYPYRLESAFEKSGIPYLRFVDDFVIFFEKAERGETIVRTIVTPILESLRLETNVGKSAQ